MNIDHPWIDQVFDEPSIHSLILEMKIGYKPE
jgi:hypothetical protein